MTKGKGAKDLFDAGVFELTAEQRKAIMKALEQHVGEYIPDDPNSPLRWYYSQSYSLGLLHAAYVLWDTNGLFWILSRTAVSMTNCAGPALISSRTMRQS